MLSRLKEDGIKPDAFTYSSMFSAYSNGGDLKKANGVLRIKPHAVTYNSMITAYSKGGELKKAGEVFLEEWRRD